MPEGDDVRAEIRSLVVWGEIDLFISLETGKNYALLQFSEYFTFLWALFTL